MLTDEQRSQRRRYLGSSDAAAVLGLNPWRTAYDVWAEKTEKIERRDTGTPATDAGNRLESVLLDRAEERLGLLDRDKMITAGHLCANLDALAVMAPEPGPVEAKTTGITGRIAAGWGEPPSEVPDYVALQVYHQMLVLSRAQQTDYAVGYVPVLMGGVGFRDYVLPRDNELIEMLEDRLDGFWRDHIQADIPPDSEPSLRTIRQLRREPGVVVRLDREILDRWLEARAVLSGAKVAEADAKKSVLIALGDAELGEAEGLDVTYLKQTRKAHSVAESTFRVLRTKKVKS